MMLTMMEQDKLIEEFGATMANVSKVSEALGDGTDEAFHSMFQRGIFDDVPVFGLFVKACNVVSDIQVYRFCKKIFRFVFLTQNCDKEKINAFWKEYATANQENGYEMMLSVLERIDNYNKVDVMANLLKAKLEGKLSIENFIRLTSSLQIAPYVDLQRLPDYMESIAIRHDTYMLFAAGLLYQSAFGVDGVGKDDSSHYQLNDNGVIFVHFGLGIDISQYVKSGAPMEFATDEDIKNMWDEALHNAQKDVVHAGEPLGEAPEIDVKLFRGQ